jgi:hypothetical protein
MESLLGAGRRMLGYIAAAGGAARPHVVEETPDPSDEESSSGDDGSSVDECQQGQNAAPVLNPKFWFEIETEPYESAAGPGAACGRDAYVKSVLNWSCLGFVGRRRMDQFQSDLSSKSATFKHICSYTVDGVIKMIQNAADSAGFTLYPHRGHKIHHNRCTSKPRSDARALMLSTMRTLEEQVAAIHPDLAPQRANRYYSKRDRYL